MYNNYGLKFINKEHFRLEKELEQTTNPITCAKLFLIIALDLNRLISLHNCLHELSGGDCLNFNFNVIERRVHEYLDVEKLRDYFRDRVPEYLRFEIGSLNKKADECLLNNDIKDKLTLEQCENDLREVLNTKMTWTQKDEKQYQEYAKYRRRS